MAAWEELLEPISAEKPSGEDLKYDPVYDQIKEARRQDDDLDLSQGAWKTEPKLADWPLTIRLCHETLKKRTKDLQLAAWLAEAWMHKEGFGGLLSGLHLTRALLETFWDTVYPEIDEDGDMEFRAAPLNWMGLKLEKPVRSVPIVRAGYNWFQYGESRKVGYEEQAKTKQEKDERAKRLKEGKLAPEDFDNAFEETPKAFYVQAEKDLDTCLEVVKGLGTLCEEKFGDATPSYGRLETTLTEVRHTIHQLLEKKRIKEPDPVEEVAVEEPAEGAESGAAESAGPDGAPAVVAAGGLVIPVAHTGDPADVREAIGQIIGAAAFLRKKDPTNPAPYLMVRGLRWGELRAAAASRDASYLEAPPTDIRQHVKRLALGEKWKELLEVAENVMGMPCSRAWLDLQRFVVEACGRLGSSYEPVARAIRGELRALLRDVPDLLNQTLMDDTPVANPATQAWLEELLNEPAPAVEAPRHKALNANGRAAAAWKRPSADAYRLASEALRKGEAGKAFAILKEEIERQNSGRGKFFRKVQLAELCTAASKDEFAQLVLDDLVNLIEAHKVDEWEDPETMADIMATIMRTSVKVQKDAKVKAKYYERICALDPVRALEV